MAVMMMMMMMMMMTAMIYGDEIVSDKVPDSNKHVQIRRPITTIRRFW